ncbi:MAG: cytochrome c3 family protein [Flavobacteriales bacterium]|nr:cytochrome c3 family protein [Flavobacteriales bacterium]
MWTLIAKSVIRATTHPIVFVACNSCHEDYHKGEFTKNGTSTDCVECHFLTDGFDVSLFSIEQHAETDFPLDGAHVATPCSECHLNEKWKKGAEKTTGEKWNFRGKGMACFDCHDNVHGEEFAETGVTDCKRCHVTGDWYPSKFDHSKTAYPLDGKHVSVDCKKCHKPDPDPTKKCLRSNYQSMSAVTATSDPQSMLLV